MISTVIFYFIGFVGLMVLAGINKSVIFMVYDSLEYIIITCKFKPTDETVWIVLLVGTLFLLLELGILGLVLRGFGL